MNDGNLKAQYDATAELKWAKKWKEDKVFHSEIDKAKRALVLSYLSKRDWLTAHWACAGLVASRCHCALQKNERFNVCWFRALIMQA